MKKTRNNNFSINDNYVSLDYNPSFYSVLKKDINLNKLMMKSKITQLDKIDNFLNTNLKRKKIIKKTALQQYFDKILSSLNTIYLDKGSIFLTNKNVPKNSKKKYKVVYTLEQLANNNKKNNDDDLIIGSKIYSNALSTDYSKNSNKLIRPFSSNSSSLNKNIVISSNSSSLNKNIVKSLNYKKPSNTKIKNIKNYFKLHKKNNISFNISKYKLNKNELYLKENLLSKNINNENQSEYIKKMFKPIKIDVENDFKKNKNFIKKYLNTEFEYSSISLANETQFSPILRYKSKSKNYNIKLIKNYEPINNIFNIKKVIQNYQYINKNKSNQVNKKKNKEITKNKIIKWKKNIYHVSLQLKRLHLNMHKFYKLYNQNNDPYKFKNTSQIFFNAIKNNNLEQIYEMFYKNRLLLVDYDYLKQNILHYFVKKNLYEYLTELIKNGANLNQKNFQGQTPLHIACQKNHFECIVILLYEISNIFIKDNEKKIAFEYWKNENYIIQKHINNITYEIKNLYLFYNEYKIKYYDLNLKKSIINIFKKIGNIEPIFNIDHIYLEKPQ